MKQPFLPFRHELIVDLFAGGGGASVAIRHALGRDPDIAVNHDPDAIDMHAVNHPGTRHYRKDVYEVDPRLATGELPVGLLHASPDCTDHSQAKGGQPRRQEIRALSWVVLKWAAQVKPRCITLENVEQILKWSPLIAKRDPATGRVIKLDRTVAAPGERVPVQQQFLVPCKRRSGKLWRRFVEELRRMGYVVQWRKLRACDFGAGTSRERLFLMARRDGMQIAWPKVTHGRNKRLQPLVTAADCIDWSIPCPSIFTRRKPLADATMRRIAKGIKRFVLDAADPFIVPIANWSRETVHPVSEPLSTITAWPKGGKDALVAPSLVSVAHGFSGGRREYPVDDPLGTVSGSGVQHAVVAAHLTKFRTGAVGSAIDEPIPTIVAGGAMKRPAGAAHALGKVAAFLEQADTGMVGHDAREPVSTVRSKAANQRVIAAHLATLRKNMTGSDARDPLRTITAGAEHHALVQYELSPEAEAGALRVAAFLIAYYSTGGGQHSDMREPMSTITTMDRLALVTVHIQGAPYVIVDIGLRMLTPPELFRATAFPSDYKMHRPDGRPFTKTTLVRLVGNSVSPPPYEALLRANFRHEERYEAAVA